MFGQLWFGRQSVLLGCEWFDERGGTYVLGEGCLGFTACLGGIAGMVGWSEPCKLREVFIFSRVFPSSSILPPYFLFLCSMRIHYIIKTKDTPSL